MFDKEVLVTPFLESWVVGSVVAITSCLQSFVEMLHILKLLVNSESFLSCRHNSPWGYPERGIEKKQLQIQLNNIMYTCAIFRRNIHCRNAQEKLSILTHSERKSLTHNTYLFIDNIMTYFFIQEIRGQIGTTTKPAVFGSFCIGHFKIAVVEMNSWNMGVSLK